MVRHGPGPLPTETSGLDGRIFDHNRENEWQGPVRYGWFDAVLARYALEVARVDALVITHRDEIRPPWKVCVGYRGLDRLPLPRSIADQERLTRTLLEAEPIYEECAPESFVSKIESLLGRRVGGVSRGPRWSDVSFNV
jgi:adenylosuccinate synthase